MVNVGEDQAVKGEVDEGYGEVADTFARNLVARGEIGAACAVYRDGRRVVDIWGGYRDQARTQPWERDTLVTVFSTTKGMTGVALAVAHSRGLFDLDDPVATYWPEFAVHGKDRITVRQLFTHEAGLAVIDVPLDLAILADLDRLDAVLAAQAPHWPPGTAHGYHGQSLGWYASALLRRVDPQGRTVGRFFADEVAAPLDLDFHIGLPDEIGPERLATFVGGSVSGTLLHIHEINPRMVFALVNPRTLTGKVFRNPKVLAKGTDINRRDLLRVEMPSVNGTGTARSLARAYSALVQGGAELGVGPATIAEIEAAVPGGPDLVLKEQTAYALGFMKPTPKVVFGSSSRAYGHGGVGGSAAFADPDGGVGYAYVMNRAGLSVPFDPRDLALRQAVYSALD
jgi:CubicO group peptidase (beta-lactamase class C family)